ncbi:MAG: hypothetical protein ACI9MR_000522 [Myxococcota bacterium]|jgi:hypothetical protein
MTDDFPELRASVADAIRAAFADSETPPAPSMMQGDRNPTVPNDQNDAFVRSHELSFQQLMAHPTPNGLIEHAYPSRFLRPSAERWFLRALLLATLDAPWDHPLGERTGSLVWSTTYWLRPYPFAVRDGRTDYDDGLSLRERLNGAQRVAVAYFLGLALAAPMFAGTKDAYTVAQSIVWCWSDDPATTRAAEALRTEARSYRRPTAIDPLAEDLICAVERAFPNTAEPVALLMNGLLDDDDCDMEFMGTQWQTLAPWFLDFHRHGFCNMEPATFRYFLPAAMCHALGPGTEVDLIRELVDRLVKPWTHRASYRDKTRARVLAFSATERAVVAEFLRASRDFGAESPCPIERAVVDFWDPDTGLQSEDYAGSSSG